VKFDEQNHVCFKVETHNHPSAIEPYGGANTGLGGVIRDVLGTGLGGKPICNTDVFCFASPETPADQLPPGTLHPRRVMRGVVAGVRDYGNRMGIPTVNGAICFDDRYLGNPLVYCGTVGLIPVGMERKQPQSNDLIVAVGGRTGRDGIHGATFSSVELTHESEQVSGGAVQIGNAITEKKVLDVILQARDRRLYTAITDCGAGGFSSAVGEMGADLGAEVHLEKAPLKYDGLSDTEIWISEAQERMVLSVPPEHWPALRDLCAGEDVEAVVLGIYAPTGRLKLYYQDQLVGDLDMHFLHNGLPKVTKSATLPTSGEAPVSGSHKLDPRSALLAILSSLNVCSKEWVIRQYDHEVQGGSVVKPLVGVKNDGPSDAAVVAPVLGSARGVAIGCGINPALGDLDPYWMAASAIDEAMRNVVAVGADPSRVALLDNFCWGNTNRPEVLGSLVRSAEACHDVALAYTTPFISGKDSLNNEYHTGKEHIIIPPTLLISALGQVPNVTQAVTMDLKSAGNRILLVGNTRDERGGSHWNRVQGMTGGMVPKLNLTLAPKIFEAVHQAILQGVVRACHDPSEGGLAVALAEMAFSGGLGIHATLPEGDPNVLLFSESNTRFVLEVLPNSELVVERTFRDLPWLELGEVTSDDKVHIAAANGQPILVAELSELKSAWQRPLAW
jgi:phosphoribosylformylglycinamidine synthase